MPASQAVPHAPQFAGSFCKSAQAPSQTAWPALQVGPPVDAPPVDALLVVALPPVPPPSPNEQPCRAAPPGSSAERMRDRCSFVESRFIVVMSTTMGPRLAEGEGQTRANSGSAIRSGAARI